VTMGGKGAWDWRISVKQAALVGVIWFFVVSSAVWQIVSFTIDPTQGAQAISPYIYGVNPGGQGGVASPGLNQTPYNNLNLTSERLGGNRWTAYNWTNNASNAGSDYIYENDGYLTNSTVPGAAVQSFLQDAANRNAAALITIPINGYVAADESGPVNPNTPPSQSSHFVPEFPTASLDPNPAANHVYQDQFLNWVQTKFPNGFTSGSKQPIFVSLDNEPDLWSATHPEVHPTPATYAEMVQRSTDYSKAIKSVSPNALVFGPVSYGWEGYLTLQNASDSSTDNRALNPRTGKAYGDFLSYYLAQMNTASQTAGMRLLDTLDVHWYPEATGLNASGTPTRITAQDSSPRVAAARLQAPRSLWDPNYVETSWITQDTTGGKGIDLIPRLQGELNANYAGTKLSISEYNYGGGADISGGIAQADVLGILGKQGMFSANEWPLASKEPFILGAMEMYRNYDGRGSTFGDTSVSASNSDITNTSIYASTDSTSPGRIVLVALNKTSAAISAAIALNNTGQHYTSFAVYQLTSNSPLNSDGTLAVPVYVNTYPISGLSSFSLIADSVTTIVPMVAAPAGTIFDWNTTAAVAANDWTAGVNWNPNGSPGFGLADVARFGKTVTIATGNTVRLNGNQTIAQLVNQNANAWILAAGDPATSALTLNEIMQSSSAALTISAAVSADGTSQMTFDGTGTGPVALTGMFSGNTSQSGLLKVVKTSSSTVEIAGGIALTNNSSLKISGGTLKINVNSGSATVGVAVTATITGNSILELAGSVSALSSGGNRVNITNSSNSTGLLVSGTNQQVGSIDGSGITQVNAGGDLTANHIIQGALIIGGTASSSASVTIDGSDASDNPLDQSGRFAMTDSLTPSGPFRAGGISSANLGSADDGNDQATIPAGDSADGDNPSPVPEPPTLLLVLLALSSVIGGRIAMSRRVRHAAS
jgi:Glycoside hydrolase family 44